MLGSKGIGDNEKEYFYYRKILILGNYYMPGPERDTYIFCDF